MAEPKPCDSNITDHDPLFASAPCVAKGDHHIHTGASGETWIDPETSVGNMSRPDMPRMR